MNTKLPEEATSINLEDLDEIKLNDYQMNALIQVAQKKETISAQYELPDGIKSLFYQDILDEYFNHDSFRGHQEVVIHNLMIKKIY